jgi:hypothetical protein
MKGTRLSELPYFSGKELAIEVHKRGVEVLGADNFMASDLMLVGLIQLVEELRDEVRHLMKVHYE